MGAWNYKMLRQHVGHNLVCVMYGDEANVAIECEDYNEVLLDYDNEDVIKQGKKYYDEYEGDDE